MSEKYELISKNLAEAIKRRRRELGYSQEKFADEIGVDRTYMSKIERSIGNPSLQKLVLIASGLRCSLTDLFSEVEFEP